MKMIRLYLVLAILTFAAPSCNNDDVTAPPITQENAFSCKINGKLFVPEDHGGFPVIQKGIIATVFEESNWRFILGNGKTDINLYIIVEDEKSNYLLGQSDGDADFFQETENVMEVDLENITGSTHVSTSESGSIEVLELEVGKRIILQFDKITLVGRNDPMDTLELTDGKLNINLETLNQE